MQPPAPHTSHKDTTLQTGWKISVHIFRKRNPLTASSSIFRIPQVCTITKKGSPDLFVICLATKNVRKILFSTRFTAVFFCFFIYYLSHANSAIISVTCSIFSHRHAFSPQNSSASSVSPFAACTSALVIQYGVFAGLQVAIH